MTLSNLLILESRLHMILNQDPYSDVVAYVGRKTPFRRVTYREYTREQFDLGIQELARKPQN